MVWLGVDYCNGLYALCHDQIAIDCCGQVSARLVSVGDQGRRQEECNCKGSNGRYQGSPLPRRCHPFHCITLCGVLSTPCQIPVKLCCPNPVSGGMKMNPSCTLGHRSLQIRLLRPSLRQHGNFIISNQSESENIP